MPHHIVPSTLKRNFFFLMLASSGLLWPLLSPPVHAADLTITGGKGGDFHNPQGGGYGGYGGYVKNESHSTWAAGGGGGGAYGDGGPQTDGGNGSSGDATSGGKGGGPGTGSGNTSSGGLGGRGNSSGGTSAGGTNSGKNGGTGGGFVTSAYTAEGGSGGISGKYGAGGKGGAAAATLSGTAVFSSVAVTSGANGVFSWSGPQHGTVGSGGAASLTADTLSAPTITLIKQDGELTFGVNTLDGSTAMSLNGTTAAGVNVGTVALSGGNTFTVNSANNGAGTFGNLNVTGAGGALAGTYAPSFTSVSLAGGSNLTAGTLNFSNLNVRGRGASYTGTLNAGAGQTLTFDLPASLTQGQPMLTVNGNANIAGSTIKLSYQTVRPTVQPGESLTLLAATSLAANQAGLTVQTASGDIYLLQVNNSQLLAILQQIPPTDPQYERLKAFAEGRTATLAFVNQGADLILNQGFGSALASTKGSGLQFSTFAAGSGGWSRYKTGSHVDVSGASILAGIAIGNDVSLGRLTAGLFFEGGWGSYNSYNSFSNYASVKGDGDTSYYGVGILGRFDVKSGALAGAYVDASARLGRADTDFSSSDIRYNGNKASFDSGSMYFGAHAGMGYQWRFSEKAMLDLSGKFIWTRQNSDNVDVQGDKMRFKDADSLRTRLGGRFSYAVYDYATLYVGAAWEHEFDGKAKASFQGQQLAAPEIKGSTGIFDLGLSISPVSNKNLSFEAGVQGYAGKRRGVTGNVAVKYAF